MAKSEKQKMLSGEMYSATDPELVQCRVRACKLTKKYNATEDGDTVGRQKIISELFGKIGDGAIVEPPLRVDYGFSIQVGVRFYANFGLVILDGTPVTIGDEVLIGPNVHIYSASHPVDPALREGGYLAEEFSVPVSIGSRVWIGGCTVINPGKSIGDGCVIGSGSVVTRDIPAYTVAAGNPCRVIRKLQPPQG